MNEFVTEIPFNQFTRLQILDLSCNNLTRIENLRNLSVRNPYAIDMQRFVLFLSKEFTRIKTLWKSNRKN